MCGGESVLVGVCHAVCVVLVFNLGVRCVMHAGCGCGRMLCWCRV